MAARAKLKFSGAAALKCGLEAGAESRLAWKKRHVGCEIDHAVEFPMDFSGAKPPRRVETIAGGDNWRPSQSKSDEQ
jgi:hypothetical protein